MPRINTISVKNKLDNMKSQKFQNKANDLFYKTMAAQKQATLEEYISDPITISIGMEENGGDAGLLGGRGSLYGFIGFENGGENPAAELGNYLNKSIELKEKVKVPGKLQMKYRISIPSFKDIRENISSPSWMGGESWVEGIERGITGLQRFIYWGNSAESGRSGAGIQAPSNDLRGDSMESRPYISRILNNFLQNIKAKFHK